MSLTRKFCKGLGLTDEQTESIIEAHTEVTDAQKTKITELEQQTGTLAAVQKELDDLKNGKDWKAEYDSLKQSFDQYKTEVAGKEAQTAKENAYRKLLTAENIPVKYHDRIVKMTDFSGVEMDGDEIKDADRQRESIKNDWGDFVATTEKRGTQVQTPPGGAGAKLTRAEIYKKDEHGRYVLSTAERQKALAENPDLMKG